MFLLNGNVLRPDVPFEVAGVQYPANWLRLASAEEKAAIGITEVPDQFRPDDRFYWVTENSDGSFSAIPKDLNDLKKQLISQCKQTAASLLSATDWKVVRAAEGAKPVDWDTLAMRAAIRSASDIFEDAVQDCQTVEELQAVQPVWPKDDKE